MAGSAKDRIISPLQRRVVNPVVLLAWGLGIPPPGDALLETTRAAHRTAAAHAEEALRVLPDPVDEHQIAPFLAPYGITTDELASWMGDAI